MPDYLELAVNKFIFRVARDRWYTGEGLWVSLLPESEGNRRVQVGLSDFLQQRSGDIAFAEIMPIGTLLAAGDEVASIETIKVNVALSLPLSGRVIDVNPALDTAPEAINQDPYGAGWLAMIEPTNWDADRSQLLDAAAYFASVQREIAEEMK